MTPSEVRQALEKAEADYWDAIDKIGERVRAENIAPFCEKRKLEYSAGMGSWSFHSTGNRRELVADGEWLETRDKELASILECRTIVRQDFGSLIESYYPKSGK